MVTIDSRARTVVRDLPRYKPGTPIEEVQRQLKRSSVIKLASNENALGPSPKALRALRKATARLNRYPDATCRDLRVRLAKHLKVAPEQLLIGNGSDELIVLALRAFVDPGDHVVVARPTFLIYELQAKACGASITAVPLRDDRYDLAAMKAAITPRTKLVFIANPDNPTGTYVTAGELEGFLKDLPSHVMVFMDEAYYEFVEANDYPQTIRKLGRAPLIITRSFSKAYGLAGLRVGYGMADPAIIRAMDAVREPFNVNLLAQAAAEAALDDRTFLTRTRRVIREGRAYLSRELGRLGLRVIPSVTNFLLIEFGPNASAVAKRLLQQGVIVREMSAWKLEGCLRVTIGTMAENRRFLRALTTSLPR
ncbi:MAG TPA: histidinol-phosphate transaminase [Candidatus Omnitrophica bacterium]|nr:MAG: histidinol-phosphate transaminase [Omnitrophica WOR_2 bacterium GWA2_63_20]OGX17844.1 MAG: histidinol-phosphate transaminase [Omnitrophica WOR_2 bacterium GWF2_63_9]OGX33302.1 MAG: histidinol-phosphate transaminase [Omnitrophica WOR_2 bacterium RIFCSPHIGHO2_12_FULL_64_13]OGX35288.1 MAG: histidinol-phosphate transaminase [Omnitrophica WOR_2 bacterium RIFCSPHIGHO2_02_FULL_63_39]OGX44762.1 MAG: histidinol-phosphate transaminase [Omnitrophica WOR_2 bacterium RIFCSPLOWO2_02_FULL_63_16]OGX48